MTTLTQHKVQEAYALLNRHSMYFYAKKIMTIALEIVFFGLALGFLIGIFMIPVDIIQSKEVLNDTMSITSTLHIDEVTYVMNFLKAVSFVFALLFFFIALLFGYIRRKDNRIRKAALLLEAAQSPTPQQF